MSSWLMNQPKITTLFAVAHIRNIMFTFILCITLQYVNGSNLSVFDLLIIFNLSLLLLDKNTSRSCGL